MAVALSLLLGGATADAVRAVWTSLAQAGESRDMLELGYWPHVTLVVVEDESLAPRLVDALAPLARLAPDSLVLGDVRQFEGTSVTWVSCAADPQLDRIHAEAVRTLPVDAIHPHYRDGGWTPHVTLAATGAAPGLLDHARRSWTAGWVARVSRLDVARFPPAVSLAGIDLPAK